MVIGSSDLGLDNTVILRNGENWISKWTINPDNISLNLDSRIKKKIYVDWREGSVQI